MIKLKYTGSYRDKNLKINKLIKSFTKKVRFQMALKNP